MGTKTETTTFDDLDNSITEGVKSIRFAFKDAVYLIDLGPENARALEDALKPYIKVAVKDEKAPKGNAPSRPGIIKWLNANGFPNAKGRPNAEQIAAYDAAH